MKKLVFIISSLIVLVVLNYSIYEKEKLQKVENIIYLELTPYDPRSLIQGDYMNLQYKIERALRDGLLIKKYPQSTSINKSSAITLDHDFKDSGYIVISYDDRRIGTFVALFNGQKLDNNEILIPYHKNKNDRIELDLPHSYLFQEGHANLYSGAKFAEIKFDRTASKFLLTALTGLDLKKISPSVK